ncbi:MAG: lytic murein transglycosylase [Methylobacter sp.]|nr:lytic murein transglycosylase [Methylobacter sp.]MDP2097701.1 lytic murein transglycosylase [Methylobacter sp.]MDP2428834.1 lytic murein transglycosylase [Methylobacter sp.]MDP3054037.1 lytic murein transglycosylase [Methylobacter sp.]MDP3361898.1 lytic murein transglycosylase [Methylobacter sp.]
MKHTLYKRIVKLAIALILSGCASNTPVQNDAPHHVTVIRPPVHKIPEQQPSQGLTGIYANSLPAKHFIQHMVREHGFSEDYLNGLFSRANRLDYVIRLETPEPYHGPKPAHPKVGGWTRYRKQFITDAHINNGVAFWGNNAEAIQKASATYGVDPEYIVAIIGVETFYGRNVGKTRTFEALTTLAFDTQRRAKFFTSELENFLLMTREENYEVFKPVGSWAGAMGLGQFMPSSFRKLAVDFNNDGRRDLWDQDDAIGSVAHYFSRSGWQSNRPVAEPAKSYSDDAVITLSADTGNEHWRVHPNFKVIKKYNNSDKYAMAVHQLAQAIKQRRL